MGGTCGERLLMPIRGGNLQDSNDYEEIGQNDQEQSGYNKKQREEEVSDLNVPCF